MTTTPTTPCQTVSPLHLNSRSALRNPALLEIFWTFFTRNQRRKDSSTTSLISTAHPFGSISHRTRTTVIARCQTTSLLLAVAKAAVEQVIRTLALVTLEDHHVMSESVDLHNHVGWYGCVLGKRASLRL